MLNTLLEILSEYPHNPLYLNRYIKFIINCKKFNIISSGIYEKHHICMKSMFPEFASFTEFPWNCVQLTPRQHYIAHLLLWKTYRNRQASFAFHIMIHGNPSGTRYNNVTSRMYETLLLDCRINNLGENHPLFGKKRAKESIEKQRKKLIGRKQTTEHITKRISKTTTTKARRKAEGKSYSPSEATRNKISASSKGISKPMSEEHIKNLKCHTNNKTQIECPHCNRVGQLTNMKRWHFDNCKQNPNRIEKPIKLVTCYVCSYTAKQSPNFYKLHNNNCNYVQSDS